MENRELLRLLSLKHGNDLRVLATNTGWVICKVLAEGRNVTDALHKAGGLPTPRMPRGGDRKSSAYREAQAATP